MLLIQFIRKFVGGGASAEMGEPTANAEVIEKKEEKQPKTKGGLTMKHQVELKLPKFLNPMFENFTPEERKKFGTVALVGGAAFLGVTVIYLTGYNRGIRKAIDSRGIYIVKGGE